MHDQGAKDEMCIGSLSPKVPPLKLVAVPVETRKGKYKMGPYVVVPNISTVPKSPSTPSTSQSTKKTEFSSPKHSRSSTADDQQRRTLQRVLRSNR